MIGYENSKIPRLFEIMEQRKLKAKDITSAIGVSSGLISDWKSGKSIPSGNRLMNLANYLNVSAEYLLGSDSEENAIDSKIQAELRQLADDQKADVLKYIEFLKSK